MQEVRGRREQILEAQRGVNSVLPAEIKCLKCVHCTIELTGAITCPTYPTSVPREIVMRGPDVRCGELTYRKLRGRSLEQREAFLRERASKR